MRRPRRLRSNPKYPIRCQDGDYFLAREKCACCGRGRWRVESRGDRWFRMTGEHVGLDSTAAEEPACSPRTQHLRAPIRFGIHRANARGNKSTDVSPGGYAEERHYLWSFVSVATVRKTCGTDVRLGLCVAPRDSRHRDQRINADERSSRGPPWRSGITKRRSRRVILQ